MKKAKKTALLISLILILTGAVIFTGAFASVGFDIRAFGAGGFEKTTKVIEDSFENIRIVSIDESVKLLPSEDNECHIEFYDSGSCRHNISVENGTLNIEQKDERPWYQNISFNFESYTMKLYLPLKSYGSVNVRTVNGGINTADDISFARMTAKTVNGSVKVNSRIDGDISLTSVNGSIVLNNIRNAGDINCDTVNGSITLDGDRAENLTVKTTNGNIRARLLVKNISDFVTTNGDIDLLDFKGEIVHTACVNGKITGRNE